MTQQAAAPKPVREAPKPEWVELKDLIADPEVQQRAGWKVEGNPAIEEYTEALKNGAKFPSIVVFEDTDMSTRIADGFTRFYSHQAAGKTKIACIVLKGTKQDAIWYACGANKNHGFRRSNKDKQHAVLTALKSPKSKGLSDRAIADHCGVSHVMVGNVRATLEGNGELAAETTRTTKTGHTQKVNTSKKQAAGVQSAAKKQADKAAPKPKPAPAPVVKTTTEGEATDFDESNPEADDAKTGEAAAPVAAAKPAANAGKAIDGDGDIVEGDLVPVFSKVSKFGKIAAALNMIAEEYDNLVKTPAGLFLGENEAGVLRSLADAVVAATPLRPNDAYENGWEPTDISHVDRNKEMKPE